MKWPRDRDARRRLVEALLDWVEALEEAEPPPEGVAPGTSTDLPDLFTALEDLEALRREVALQGRTFSKLTESTGKVSESLADLAREDPRHDPQRLEEARFAGRREVITRLLEAREGMARSLRVARETEERLGTGILLGRKRREVFSSLRRALEMNLEAVDEALRDIDIREIRCEGDIFDPETMRAVEVADPGEGRPGTVVAVLRTGWWDGHRVYRPAEVRAAPGDAEGD